MSFLFRLAFTLKKSLKEILALPAWERCAWRYAFEVWGPLDWKRNDFLFGRVNQYQAVEQAPLKDFILFTDPQDEPTREEKEAALLRQLGYNE